MSRENAEHALEAFSKKMGIADLRFDKSGTALLAFGDEQELIFFYSEEINHLQIWSPLNDVMLSGKDDVDCALMKYLLEKNFPSSVLNGASFAIDGEIGVVLLGRTVPVDPQNMDKFADMITGFAQQVLAITATMTNEVSEAFTARMTSHATDGDTPIIKA